MTEPFAHKLARIRRERQGRSSACATYHHRRCQDGQCMCECHTAAEQLLKRLFPERRVTG
jgi:hypothetical protein